MTKEEAKDILRKMSEDNFYGNHVQEACRVAIKALSPRPGSQEDIIYQAVQEVCHVDNPRAFAEHNQTVFEVAKKALDLSKPSLPSNIDEAAEEWCKANNKGIALSADRRSHYLAEGMDAFKAGAEWMAGQGIKLHGRILPGTRCNLYIESDCFDRGYRGLNYKFSESNDVDMFVQIRKKQ